MYNEILISSFLAVHWAGINQWDLSHNQPDYAKNVTLGPQCVYISPPLSKQPTENPIANRHAGQVRWCSAILASYMYVPGFLLSSVLCAELEQICEANPPSQRQNDSSA